MSPGDFWSILRSTSDITTLRQWYTISIPLSFGKQNSLARFSETPDWLAGYEGRRIRRMPDTEACGARNEAGSGLYTRPVPDTKQSGGGYRREISGATGCYRAISPWGVCQPIKYVLSLCVATISRTFRICTLHKPI